MGTTGEKITLKWILKKQVMKMLTALYCLRRESNGGVLWSAYGFNNRDLLIRLLLRKKGCTVIGDHFIVSNENFDYKGSAKSILPFLQQISYTEMDEAELHNSDICTCCVLIIEEQSTKH